MCTEYFINFLSNIHIFHHEISPFFLKEIHPPLFQEKPKNYIVFSLHLVELSHSHHEDSTGFVTVPNTRYYSPSHMLRNKGKMFRKTNIHESCQKSCHNLINLLFDKQNRTRSGNVCKCQKWSWLFVDFSCTIT